jgi:hypothetical protein
MTIKINDKFVLTTQLIDPDNPTPLEVGEAFMLVYNGDFIENVMRGPFEDLVGYIEDQNVVLCDDAMNAIFTMIADQEMARLNASTMVH